MRNRVVITGLGCVSPLGNDVASTWDGLVKGKPGIDRITKFDATDFRSRMAGEVKNFDPSSVIPPSEQKKMDIFIHYALVATAEALQDAGLEIDDEVGNETGVSVGIGLGGLTTIEKYHEVYLERGPRRITPFFIPMVISNMASGQISLYFNCRNYNASTTSACANPVLRLAQAL